MRAVKGSLGHSFQERHKKTGRPSLGLLARLGVPVGGRVRTLRAVEDQSAPIPKIMGDLGKKGRIPALVLCSRSARPEKGLVRRPHVDQHGCPSKSGNASELGGIKMADGPSIKEKFGKTF